MERLFVKETYLPLSTSLNPSITKQITDLENPDKRKASSTKTVLVPNSKEANKIFSQVFELNMSDLTFNVQAKALCWYEIDSEIQIYGYCQLRNVKILDEEINYEIVIYSQTADFFADIRDKYLEEVDLSDYNHPLTKEIQELSWETQILVNGVLQPFNLGQGYVYPLIDYGFSSDATNFSLLQIGCAIYAREYMTRIISEAGYTYTSSFLDGTFFEHLIIPSSPEVYQLTEEDIEDREFAANTPVFNSSGSTISSNLPYNTYSPNSFVRFTNELFDTGLNYNPATGEFEAVYAGTYDFTVLIDVTGRFAPSTATPVKTIADIRGYVKLYITPNGSMTESLIDETEFIITSDDSAFISGARSTSTTPTYPDTDYLASGKYSIWPNDLGADPRPASPPDRYQLTVTGITLQPGDVIKPYISAGIFRKTGTFTSSNRFFEDSLGGQYPGNATIDISVGSFYNKCVNTTLTEGNTLLMSKVIPKNIKQIDFFTSILKMFNLWLDIDPNNDKNLIIEQREDYLGTDELNIHELIDRSKDFVIEPMGALDVRRFMYKYKEDKDYFNELYTQEFQEIYGQRRVDSTNEFYTQDKETNVIFSPTVMAALPGSDRVLPTIYQMTDDGVPKPTKHNIRILYYGGMLPCSQGWNHINYVSVFSIPLVDTYVEYPYAGHFDHPFTPTLDINWGLVRRVYYDDNLQDIVVTNNNLVNKYHGKYLREITDEDSRIVKCYVRLTPAMYTQFTFDKIYFFDYAYFRLQSIEGYVPTSEETVLCTFLKLNDASVFTPTTATSTGADIALPPNQTGGTVDMEERLPAKGQKSSNNVDNNNYSTRSANVLGENNYIGLRTKYIEITGSGNQVLNGSTKIKIQGDNNVVRGGLTNVTLINTSGVTVEESNVTYINGKKQGGWITQTSSFAVDDTVYGYNLDGTSAVVQMRLNNSESEFFIKCINSDNRVYVDAGGLTIDNTSSEFDLVENESIRLRWNGEENTYNIIN